MSWTDNETNYGYAWQMDIRIQWFAEFNAKLPQRITCARLCKVSIGNYNILGYKPIGVQEVVVCIVDFFCVLCTSWYFYYESEPNEIHNYKVIKMQTVALFIEEFYCVLNVEIVPDHAGNCDYIFVVIFRRISSSFHICT